MEVSQEIFKLDKERLCKIKYLVIDVDGTMTDAGIYYDEHLYLINI